MHRLPIDRCRSAAVRVAITIYSIVPLVAVVGCDGSVATTISTGGSANSAGATSVDLPGDLKLMWETQPLPGQHDPSHGPNPFASTERAILAANRVFNTVQLLGKTQAEIIADLGDPATSSNSIYNFPFYPPPLGALVYRFDTGAGGYQFNVIFDDDGKSSELQRNGIE
jgi:hypothetical protein